MEHQSERSGVVEARAAPTSKSIAIFAVVVAVLFGGMYFLTSDGSRSTVTSNTPTVAQPATPSAPPATTGQGGNTK